MLEVVKKKKSYFYKYNYNVLRTKQSGEGGGSSHINHELQGSVIGVIIRSYNLYVTKNKYDRLFWQIFLDLQSWFYHSFFNHLSIPPLLPPPSTHWGESKKEGASFAIILLLFIIRTPELSTDLD